MAEPVNSSVRGRPGPAVSDVVSAYVGYHMDGLAPGVHAGLPSRTLTVVLSIDDPVDLCAMPDPAQRPGRFQALIGGLHDAPAGIRHRGRQHGVQLELTPLGARRLFGLPAGALARTVVDLADLGLPGAASLADRLASTPTWPGRFEVLDEVLASWARPAGEPRAELRHAWELLARADGGVDVGAVAAEVGWSRRHLAERFRIEFGLPPKVMARVMRFERARDLLAAGRAGDLATVAALAGYSDQPHLTREWRALAGSTPAGWLRGEGFSFVQDAAPGPART